MTSDLEKRSAELHQREEDLAAERERVEQRLKLLQVWLTRVATIGCLSQRLGHVSRISTVSTLRGNIRLLGCSGADLHAAHSAGVVIIQIRR